MINLKRYKLGLLSLILAGVLVGCGGGGGDSSSNTNNIPNSPELEVETSLTTYFQGVVDYTGGVVPIRLYAAKTKYSFDELNSVTFIFKHSINGVPYEVSYGFLYYNVVMDIFEVQHNAYIPFNKSDENKSHTFQVFYMKDITELIQSVSVIQTSASSDEILNKVNINIDLADVNISAENVTLDINGS